MFKKQLFFLFSILILLLAGCTNPTPATTAPSSPAFKTSTPPLQTATSTPVVPTLTSAPRYITGVVTTLINVRSAPTLTSSALGQLNAKDTVQVIGRDETGKWYQILFPSAPDRHGWVSAQFIQIPIGTEVPPQATLAGPGVQGLVLQRLNVRSGPAVTFASLGVLEAYAYVSLTGKNSTASWFQIAYPAGPNGLGWVTAQYIQADASTLPVLDDYGTPVANETSSPTAIFATLTPTVGPAVDDHDSAAQPAIQVAFSATGTRQFTYTNQVSFPQGDVEDWIAFTPFAINSSQAHLVFTLVCSGNGSLKVEIWQNGSVYSGWGSLSCEDANKLILLPGGQNYLIHLTALPAASLQLVNYVLTVVNQLY